MVTPNTTREEEEQQSSGSSNNAPPSPVQPPPLTSSSDALTRYTEIRNELMEDIEQMAAMLHADQDIDRDDPLVQTLLKKVDTRLKQIREDRLTIGVFGETCSGKSTLINTLSRREVTRPDVVSNTGVIMEFVYGKEEEVALHFLDGRVQKADWDEITEYTDQLHNPENHKGVARVRIVLPMDYLQNGIRFFDTPGLNDVVRDYSTLSTQWLNSMGAVIVTSLYPPFTRSEVDFLKRASHQCSKLFIVINLSQDYWPQRERLKTQVLRNIARDPDLRHHPDLKPENIRIYVMNARKAWEATETENAELLEESGFGTFREDIEHFLTQDASRTVLASSIRSSFEVVTLLQKLLTLRAKIVFAERDVVEEKLKELHQSYKKAELKKYELFDAIDGEVEALLEKVVPTMQDIVAHTVTSLNEVKQLKSFPRMTEDLELLYKRNLEESATLELLLTERIESIFEAAYKWLFRQLDDLLLLQQPEDDLNVRPFAFSQAQKSLLGIFGNYDDKVGLAEAVVGISALASGGSGVAMLTPILGPLAFPVGGAGGLILGMFARNFMKARALRDHIQHQLQHIESSRELLPDKLRVVLNRIASDIKEWVSTYFAKLFASITRQMEEHSQKINEESYLEEQRQHLETRQASLDQVRDRFLLRLHEIYTLLQLELPTLELDIEVSTDDSLSAEL